MSPIQKKEKITEATVQAAIAMFMDDEYSRQMPGQKDCVTVNGVKFQKRLMLVTVKELFRSFRYIKENNPNCKIALTKFSTLRPKWCILVGSTGSHNVCTCIQHENAKLLCSETDFDYKVLS